MCSFFRYLYSRQFVFSYFIKLVTMFAIWKIPSATRSNGKQNISYQNKIDWQ